MGGGPSGLARLETLSVRSTDGLAATRALEPEVSNRPPAIQLFISAISWSLMGGLFGGMNGSSAWVRDLMILLASGWPETTTGPVPPPLMTPACDVRSRSPFFLSGLWHLAQCCSTRGRM